MNRMKYIMLDYGPVIFNECYTHAEMAAGREVSSAGFVQVDENGRFHTYGESTSLGVKSNPEDSKRINKDFNVEDE